MAPFSQEQARFIESWRRFIPNRVEREDPFAESPFGMRPSTQLSFHPPQNPEPSRRASTRLSFFRAATPLFGRSSTPAQASAAARPATVLGLRSAWDDNPGSSKRGFFRRLLYRGYKEKRARSPTPEPFFIAAEPIRLNFLFVGPKSSGQTSLLFRSRYGYFPDDTSGAPDLNAVTTLSYMKWDAIFLCFDTMDKISMFSIMSWWHHAIVDGFLESQRFVPMLYLVGMKKDLREQRFLERSERRTRTPASFPPFPLCCVCPADAAWHAGQIGAEGYLECSALTGDGMDRVIEDVGIEATRRTIMRMNEAAAADLAAHGGTIKKRRRLF
ncbi:unnamed protein product [Clonostachys rosea f. rosea IK726]|uniref:P-loop containing nucleoside triphosphate hydrolase protein n=2 Tax=Bionectria ochroleuca TaxID=29856 RepID=A0A0B7KN89_BIOOC|nr:unnamed protein product [Clonostachys rosea f. rosea IK726]